MRSGNASWIGFDEDRAEAGHGDEIDVVAPRTSTTLVRVRDRSKSAPKSVRSTSSAATPASWAMSSAAARPVGEHDDDGMPRSSMARRMVPLPDARTPTRT